MKRVVSVLRLFFSFILVCLLFARTHLHTHTHTTNIFLSDSFVSSSLFFFLFQLRFWLFPSFYLHRIRFVSVTPLLGTYFFPLQRFPVERRLIADGNEFSIFISLFHTPSTTVLSWRFLDVSFSLTRSPLPYHVYLRSSDRVLNRVNKMFAWRCSLAENIEWKFKERKTGNVRV